MIFVCFHNARFMLPTWCRTLPNSVRDETFGNRSVRCRAVYASARFVITVCDKLQARFVQTAYHSALHRHPLAMPTVHVTVHPRGLHPVEAARARQLHVEEGMAIWNVCEEVVNMLGAKPSVKAVWRAIQAVKAVALMCV